MDDGKTTAEDERDRSLYSRLERPGVDVYETLNVDDSITGSPLMRHRTPAACFSSAGIRCGGLKVSTGTFTRGITVNILKYGAITAAFCCAIDPAAYPRIIATLTDASLYRNLSRRRSTRTLAAAAAPSRALREYSVALQRQSATASGCEGRGESA